MRLRPLSQPDQVYISLWCNWQIIGYFKFLDFCQLYFPPLHIASIVLLCTGFLLVHTKESVFQLLQKFEGLKALQAPCEFSRDLAKDHVCLFVMFLYVMRTYLTTKLKKYAHEVELIPTYLHSSVHSGRSCSTNASFMFAAESKIFAMFFSESMSQIS